MKKLNQKGIAVLIVVVIAVVAVALATAGYLFYRQNNPGTLELSDIQSENFNFGPPYRVDGKITSEAGEVITFKVDVQDENTTRGVIGGEGTTIETISTADATYTNFGGDSWTKVARDPNAKDDPLDDLAISESDIEQVRDEGKVVGSAPCRDMTCTEFKFNDELGNEWSIFIDNASKRPIRATGNTAEGTIEIDYYYEDVSIQIPSDDQIQTTGEFDLGDLNLEDFNF